MCAHHRIGVTLLLIVTQASRSLYKLVTGPMQYTGSGKDTKDMSSRPKK